MSTAIRSRSWLVAHHRIATDVYTMPVLWGIFAGGVVAFVAVLSTFVNISSSAWESASALPRWYMAGVGVYATAVYLPLYVAHGVTRREVLALLPVYILALVTALSVLMTLGYALESLIYGSLGWTQRLTNVHLFASPTQLQLVFTEFWLLHLVWISAGTLVGAAFYRHGGLGVLSLLVGLAAVGMAETALGPRMIGPIRIVPAFVQQFPVAGAAALCVALAALVQAAARVLSRNVPIRSKAG